MDVKQENRIRMFKATDLVLQQHESVWNGMAPFVAVAQQVTDGIAAIDLAVQKQSTATAGATLDRTTARDALEDVLFLVSEALGVLAHAAGDHELRDLTDLKPSDLQRMSDEELATRAQAIANQTTSRKTELATLHVSQANLDELTEALENFQTSKSAPRAAVANRMAQTESLPELINRVNTILRNQLDRMVNLFRRTHPDFVAAYRAARVIIDRAATRTAAKPKAPVGA
jgi:hypothetical protein